MKQEYCVRCGERHQPPVNDACNIVEDSSSRLAMATRSSKKSLLSTLSEESCQHDILMSEEDTLSSEILSLERQERLGRLRRRKDELLKNIEDNSADSDELCHHRRHNKCHRHNSSSSDSSNSRTPSRERKIKSKWSLKKYTTDRKKVNKLNLAELIESSCLWVLDFFLNTFGFREIYKTHIIYVKQGKN